MTARDEGLARLEVELRLARQFGARAAREMHGVVLADLAAAERRARQAERRAAVAEQRAKRARRRARRAERELALIRRSTTWRVGRVVIAGPAHLRRLVRGQR